LLEKTVFVGILNLPLLSKPRAYDAHRLAGNDDGFGLVGQDDFQM
jgi:hypothetical protein